VLLVIYPRSGLGFCMLNPGSPYSVRESNHIAIILRYRVSQLGLQNDRVEVAYDSFKMLMKFIWPDPPPKVVFVKSNQLNLPEDMHNVGQFIWVKIPLNKGSAL